MTNYTTVELNAMNAENLRNLAREIQMPGAWKAKKIEMIEAIIKNQLVKEATDLSIILAGNETISELQEMIETAKNLVNVVLPEPTSKPQPQARRKGRTRTIEIYKDGALLHTVAGLIETFKYVTENNITNVGWVKRSLKTGEETNAGYKYKVGGYLFKYAE